MIEVSTNNGTSWSTIIGSTPSSTGSYPWTIPNSPSTQCKVRLTDVADTSIKSTSSNTFIIAPVPTITITSPNGGENWKIGDADTVRWTSSDVTNVMIEYTTDNGISWTTITASTSASAESYIWTIPNTPSVNCKVRISDFGNAGTNSSSNSLFTISN